uniref:Uncharacterized protein n=1 Tax=Arundo donax TaxID=35708 RepID=A0A0A9GPX2_ARUDO
MTEIFNWCNLKECVAWNNRLIMERQSSYTYIGKEPIWLIESVPINQGILGYSITPHKAGYQECGCMP